MNHHLPLSRPALLLALIPLIQHVASAADGYWKGNLSVSAPAANYTAGGNWTGGTAASGSDETAAFDFNPTQDGAGASGALFGGSAILDTATTLGHIAFNDRDGWGSASMALNAAATPVFLTLQTSTGVPTYFAGQLLNAQSGGKKAFISAPLAGTQGLQKTGAGHAVLSSATASTISGMLQISGGMLEFRTAYTSFGGVTVERGGSLLLSYNQAGVPLTGVFSSSIPLTLAGGSVVNGLKAATSTSSQTWNGLVLDAGASAILGSTNTNQNLTYTFGSIMRNPHSAINFAKPTAAGTLTLNTTTPNEASGILGAWAVYAGNTWATESGGAIVGLADASYTANTWGTSVKTNVTVGRTIAAASTAQSLRFNTGHASILNLSGLNVIQDGGIISAQQAPILRGGSITSGRTDGDLMIHANGGGNQGFTIESAIVNNGATAVSLIKGSQGQMLLSGNNTYTGGTWIGGGTTYIGAGPLGGASGSLGTGAVQLDGINTATGSYNIPAVLAFNRSGTYTPANAINATTAGGGFIAQAAGGSTLVLNRAMKVGGLITWNGTTNLDFSAAGAPVRNIIDGTTAAGSVNMENARLNLQAGGLTVTGAAGAANEQQFALTQVLGSSKVSLAPGAGGSVHLELGALSRVNNSVDSGGLISATVPAGATLGAYSGAASTIVTDTGVPYVTVNGDWGAKDATNKLLVAGGTLSGFYTDTAGTGLVTGTQNHNVTVNDSVTGTVLGSSLRFNTAAAADIALNSGAIYGPGGVLVTDNVGANNVTISGAGTLRANSSGNRDLPVIQNNTAGKLTISAAIGDFTANTDRTTLAKSGNGELELTGANTYTGRTVVNDGTLRLSGTGAVASATTRAGNVLIHNAALTMQDSSAIFSNAAFIVGHRIGDNGVMNMNGTSKVDVSGDFNVGDVSAKGVLNFGNGTDNPSIIAKSFFVGKFGYAEGTVEQKSGSITAGNTPANEWYLGGGNSESTLAKGTYNMSGGTFSPGGQAWQVGRNGTGEMNVSGTAAVSGTGWHVIGRFHSGSGTVSLSGDATWNANAGGAGQNAFIVGEVGRGTLNVSGNAVLTAKNMSIAHDGGFGEVNQDGGIVDLVNTANYTQGGPSVQGGVTIGMVPAPGLTQQDHGGTYNLNGGVLRTFSVARSSGSAASAAMTFDGGTIQAKGNNPTFIQGLTTATIEDGGATVDTNAFNVTIGQKLEHDATLGATLDGGLTKLSSGILTLAADNTYTGATTVSGGNLQIDGSITSAVSLASSTTLSGIGTVGGNVVTTSAFLSPGQTGGTGIGKLTVNGSVSLDSASTLVISISDDLASAYDNVTTTSGFNIGGATLSATFADSTFDIAYDAVTLATATRYEIISGPTTGMFGNATPMSATDLAYLGLASGSEITISGQRFYVETGSVKLVPISPVPEPGVFALAGASAALLLRRRRRLA